MCLLQGPPGVAGPQGPRGLPGNLVGPHDQFDVYCVTRFKFTMFQYMFFFVLFVCYIFYFRVYQVSPGFLVLLEREETRSHTSISCALICLYRCCNTAYGGGH